MLDTVVASRVYVINVKREKHLIHRKPKLGLQTLDMNRVFFKGRRHQFVLLFLSITWRILYCVQIFMK